MKKRALAAALCCLSTASATAVAAPVATAQTATAKKTMADQFQPTFPEWSRMDDLSERISVEGVPYGTKLTALNPGVSGGGNEEGELSVIVFENGEVWLWLFSESDRYGKTVSTTVDLAVEYPDGSTEVVTHTFTVHPAEKLQHNPTIDRGVIEVGMTTTVKVLDIPSTASVTLLKVPQDWNVKQEGNTFTVIPPVEGNGEFVYKVAFSDGTSKVITNSVQARKVVPKPTTPKETGNPQLPGVDTGTDAADDKQSTPAFSGGSSTAGIIAGVIGVVLTIALSIGGAAFAGLIPGLKLPF